MVVATDAEPQERWDLVVVGAGPAGTATALAALAAAPGLRVLLLDRSDFPRDKSCGDGIAPHVLDALSGVGVHDLTDGWTPMHRLHLARPPLAVERALARPAWVIPREVFDARLVARAVAAGAVLRRHRVRDIRVRADGVLVDGRILAPVVVGADGAHSVVRAAVALPPVRRRALAIRGYAPTPAERCGKQLIVYGTRRQTAYAWSFDRGDGWSNVGYGEVLDGGAGDHGDRGDRGERAQPPSRALLLAHLEQLLPGAASGGGRWRGHQLPFSGWRWSHPEGRVLLAGDAAGLVNPMTGEGIYYAVATGILAGQTAAQTLRAAAPDAGTTYRTGVRQLLGTHLRHTWVAARLTARPAVVEAGIQVAGRDQRCFDDLVEIGLGRGLLTPRLTGRLALELTRHLRRERLRVRRAG